MAAQASSPPAAAQASPESVAAAAALFSQWSRTFLGAIDKLSESTILKQLNEGRDALAKRLIDLNQPIKVATRSTMLHTVSWFQKASLCEFLLSFGANPNQPNDKGNTPLMLLCEKPNAFPHTAKLIQTFIDAGGDVRQKNALGVDSIQMAKSAGVELADIVKFRAEALKDSTGDGVVPSQPESPVFELLRSMSASIVAAPGTEARGALIRKHMTTLFTQHLTRAHTRAAWAVDDFIIAQLYKYIRLIVDTEELDIDSPLQVPNTVTTNGTNPGNQLKHSFLHYAVVVQRPDLVLTLLGCEPDVSTPDTAGRTAFHLACQELDAAYKNGTDQERIQAQHIAEYLLDAGTTRSQKDASKKSAIDYLEIASVKSHIAAYEGKSSRIQGPASKGSTAAPPKRVMPPPRPEEEAEALRQEQEAKAGKRSKPQPKIQPKSEKEKEKDTVPSPDAGASDAVPPAASGSTNRQLNRSAAAPVESPLLGQRKVGGLTISDELKPKSRPTSSAARTRDSLLSAAIQIANSEESKLNSSSDVNWIHEFESDASTVFQQCDSQCSGRLNAQDLIQAHQYVYGRFSTLHPSCPVHLAQIVIEAMSLAAKLTSSRSNSKPQTAATSHPNSCTKIDAIASRPGAACAAVVPPLAKTSLLGVVFSDFVSALAELNSLYKAYCEVDWRTPWAQLNDRDSTIELNCHLIPIVFPPDLYLTGPPKQQAQTLKILKQQATIPTETLHHRAFAPSQQNIKQFKAMQAQMTRIAS